MTISVDPDGTGFVIRQIDQNGLTVSEVKATGTDILLLAQSAQRLRAAVLESLHPAGGQHQAVYSTIVHGIALHDSSLRDELLLTLIAPNQSETVYSLTIEQALHLSERLAIRASGLKNQKLSE